MLLDEFIIRICTVILIKHAHHFYEGERANYSNLFSRNRLSKLYSWYDLSYFSEKYDAKFYVASFITYLSNSIECDHYSSLMIEKYKYIRRYILQNIG